MKHLLISDECIACGNCFSTTDLIIENDEGKAAVEGLGSLSDDEAKTLSDIIVACPVHAITLVATGDTAHSNSIDDVIQALNNLKGYKLERPSDDEFICDKSELHVAAPTSGVTSRFSYRSDSQAEREGLSAFNQVAYSQKRMLAASALVVYKKKYLGKFTDFTQDDSCYYYVENRKIELQLESIAKEFKELTKGKRSIPAEMLKFQFEPQSFRSLRLVVNEFEDLKACTMALENVESLSWYDSFVDTDEKELATRSLYRYNIQNVIETLCKHIVDGCMYAIRTAGPEAANAMIDLHQKMIDKELPKRIDEIVNYIKRHN